MKRTCTESFHFLFLLEHLLWCSVYDPAEMFLTLQVFSYLLFLQPHTHKTKTGIANRLGGETTNNKPPGPIITVRGWETGSRSQILFITLFSLRC
jgi:hypothetical protein